MEHTDLHLQGCKPAEDLAVHEIIDGVCGRVEIVTAEIRVRPDMAPLVLLRAGDGQRLSYDAGFPVAYYGRDEVVLERFGRNPVTAPIWAARQP